VCPGGFRRSSALVAAACVLIVLALLPRALTPPVAGSGQTFRVALVQNEPGEFAGSMRLSREHPAHWILWPELAVLSDVTSDAAVRSKLEQLARDTGAVVGVGAELRHPTAAPNFWNAFVLFGPDGNLLGRYHKMQPVPMMLDGVPGTSYTVFDTPEARLGVAICYDADFTWICRRLVENGAEVLAVPVYDPARWGARMRRQHVAAAVLRAIETGRPVLRVANAGPTLIIDPAGRIVERREETSPGAVTGRVSPRRDRTPFVRFGWLLPYACQAASVVLLVWAVVARCRRKK
jgi:apolipoprotein N-acyltransferase